MQEHFFIVNEVPAIVEIELYGSPEGDPADNNKTLSDGVYDIILIVNAGNHDAEYQANQEKYQSPNEISSSFVHGLFVFSGLPNRVSEQNGNGLPDPYPCVSFHPRKESHPDII